MNKPPAFQFYAKDYRSSPSRARMTMRDKGIFLELLALAWDSPQQGVISLPFDEVAEDIGVTPATLTRYVREFQTTCTLRADGAIVIKRLAEQSDKYKKLSEIRSAAAKIKQANAPIAFAGCSLQVATEDLKPKAAAKSAALDFVNLPDWVPEEQWRGFVEMRGRLRKPLTGYAVKLAVAKLEKLRNLGHEPKTVLEQSVLNGWQGLFPIRVESANGNGSKAIEREQRSKAAIDSVLGGTIAVPRAFVRRLPS